MSNNLVFIQILSFGPVTKDLLDCVLLLTRKQQNTQLETVEKSGTMQPPVEENAMQHKLCQQQQQQRAYHYCESIMKARMLLAVSV